MDVHAGSLVYVASEDAFSDYQGPTPRYGHEQHPDPEADGDFDDLVESYF